MRYEDKRGALSDALTHLAILRTHVAKGDMNEMLTIDAVSRGLEVAIENLMHGDIGEKVFGDNSHVIRGIRNRLAHGYTDADPEINRETVANDLDDFEARIRSALTSSDLL